MIFIYQLSLLTIKRYKNLSFSSKNRHQPLTNITIPGTSPRTRTTESSQRSTTKALRRPACEALLVAWGSENPKGPPFSRLEPPSLSHIKHEAYGSSIWRHMNFKTWYAFWTLRDFRDIWRPCEFQASLCDVLSCWITMIFSRGNHYQHLSTVVSISHYEHFSTVILY